MRLAEAVQDCVATLRRHGVRLPVVMVIAANREADARSLNGFVPIERTIRDVPPERGEIGALMLRGKMVVRIVVERQTRKGGTGSRA